MGLVDYVDNHTFWLKFHEQNDSEWSGIELLTMFKRCERINNPCGSDTYQVENECQCRNCKEWRKIK